MTQTLSQPQKSETDMKRPRPGVLLVNLGTPDEPTTGAVRRYLREFLSDPRVIDIHPAARNLLVYGVILPFRSPKSAEAYRKIWTSEGSPLLVHSLALTKEVAGRLGPDVPVALAMRYGNPSVAEGLRRLRERNVDHVVVVPLYPQYASSSTGTVLEMVYRETAAMEAVPTLSVVPPFYDHAGFIQSWVETGRPVLDEIEPDHVLMSYHGLPERQIRKVDDTGSHCLESETCCSAIGDANRNCYRAQCFRTSELLGRALGLDPGRYTVAFQSRLGRTPWIKPYTDVQITELARRGVKRLVVFSPSFVADCLETLEEIDIRGREQFLGLGGEAFALVPSLNANPGWIDTVVKLIRPHLGQGALT